MIVQVHTYNQSSYSEDWRVSFFTLGDHSGYAENHRVISSEGSLGCAFEITLRHIFSHFKERWEEAQI